jgi:hypothetical protein
MFMKIKGDTKAQPWRSRGRILSKHNGSDHDNPAIRLMGCHLVYFVYISIALPGEYNDIAYVRWHIQGLENRANITKRLLRHVVLQIEVFLREHLLILLSPRLLRPYIYKQPARPFPNPSTVKPQHLGMQHDLHCHETLQQQRHDITSGQAAQVMFQH